MGKLIMKSASLTNDSELKVPKFNFLRYQRNVQYHNDENSIDFVTDGKSLYVCLVTCTPTHEKLADEPNFLKLVSEGPQGIKGPKGEDGSDAITPIINAEFVGDQLKLIVDDKVIALSPSLTGPIWKPVLEDNAISWELTNDKYLPESIDLDTLRPIQKKPLLLRTDSDNTKRSDEVSGPAKFIQWKYEGDEHWTNLISISELMNLALAGVSVWKNEEDGKWHIGHRQVVQASYASDKEGHKIISNVELGDVLFDAGELPFAEQEGASYDYGPEIDLILAKLAQLEADVVKSVNHIGPDASGNVDVQTSGSLDGYATQNWVTGNFQPKGNYVTSVNGVAPQPGSNGAITISVGNLGSFDVRLNDDQKTLEKTTDGINWISIVDLSEFGGSGGGSGIPESEVKHLIGLILEGALDSAIPEYVKGSDHNYFIRLNDLANYTTITQVASMIRDAMTGQNVDYYRVFTLYQRTNSPTVAPAKPVVGVWEWNTAADTDTIVLKPNASSAWSNHPENATTLTPYLWMTSATYSYLTKSEINTDNQQNPWETPICLTGESGEDGADGDSVEFAYILCTETEFNNIKNTTPVAEHGDNRNDDLPTYTTPSGNGWTDHPSGISETYPIEAVTIRTKDNGTWGAYSNPTIWSMWGEDGMDGDGVEYIFAVAAENETVVDASGKRELSAAFFRGQSASQILPLTDQEVTTLGADYQIDDWCPDGTIRNGVQMYDLNWTDNPSDVGPDQPYEFVAIRKKKLDPVSGQMKWGPFSTPALWGFWGTTTVYQAANSYFKPYTCFAFVRSTTDISNYTVVNPWTYADQTYAAWIAADNTREDGYYENPLAYVITLDANNQVVPSSTLTWSDTIPAPPGQLYMITNHIGDEASGNDQGWTSPRAWGDASGFQVEYANSSTATDDVYARVKTLIKLDNYDLDTYPNLNDPDNDGIDEAAWRAAVLAAGMGVWGDENDITEPDYMAVCYKKQEGVWSNWQVSRIKGEQGEPGQNGQPGPAGRDGTDIEFIYYRTKSVTKPTISTNAYKVGNVEFENDDYDDIDDALPKVANYTNAGGSSWSDGGRYWHDNPSGVTSTYKYEWVSCRRSYYDSFGVKTWEPFYTPATLWSKYGENGHDGDGIEYVFWDLTEAQAGSISGDVLPTRLSETSYTDSHNPARHINESECLPSITLNVNGTNITLEAKDDNPGISDQKPYVYASMRKYNGILKQWGEFSAIKLWLIKETPEYEVVTLNIENDHQQIVVDSNDNITSSELNCSYSLGKLSLHKNNVLLSNGKVSVNDTLLAQLDDTGVTVRMVPTQNTVTVTSNGVSATVSASYAYKNEDSLTSSIALNVTFQNNTTLTGSFEIPVTVTDATDEYAGTDLFVLVPAKTRGLELKKVPDTQKTTERGSHTYASTWTFWGTPIYGTLDQVKTTNYWFGFDNVAAVKFCLNANQLADVATYDDGTQARRLNYYFDKTGTAINTSGVQNVSNYFYRIQINNADYNDNSDPWRRWTCTAYVNSAAFVSDGTYPIDSLYFAIGVDNVITDEAVVPIVYPGAQGQRGETGKSVRISVWEPGKNYYNGTVAVDGVYYSDIVTLTDISTNGGSGVDYYECIISHVSSSTFAADQATKWRVLNNTTPTVTPVILANKISAGNIDVDSLFVSGNIDVDVTTTEGGDTFTNHLDIDVDEITLTETRNGVIGGSAGITIRPKTSSISLNNPAVVNIWQHSAGPALIVDGIIKQEENLFANSIIDIDTAGNTFNVCHNLAIVTHGSNAGGTNYSTANLLISTTQNWTEGCHITFLRTSTGVCRIQLSDESQIRLVSGSSYTPVNYVEFTATDNKVDIIRLGNYFYAWKS